MFLHLSVSNSVHGGMHGRGSVRGKGGKHGWGWHAWWRGVHGGACMAGACVAGGAYVVVGLHGAVLRVCMAGACVAGGICGGWPAWSCVEGVYGRGHAWQRALGCVHGRGMHARETATEEGGTHPTGMHSCFTLFVR